MKNQAHKVLGWLTDQPLWCNQSPAFTITPSLAWMLSCPHSGFNSACWPIPLPPTPIWKPSSPNLDSVPGMGLRPSWELSPQSLGLQRLKAGGLSSWMPSSLCLSLSNALSHLFLPQPHTYLHTYLVYMLHNTFIIWFIFRFVFSSASLRLFNHWVTLFLLSLQVLT